MKDLDDGDIGGVITWNEPLDLLHVAYYSIYLADDVTGTGRYQWAPDLSPRVRVVSPGMLQCREIL